MQEKEYRELHGLEPQDALSPDSKKFVEAYKSTGHRTAPCCNPLEQEQIMQLAHDGHNAAIIRAKFEGWVPFTFVPSAENAPSPEVQGPMSQDEAERRHVLAIVCNASSFASASEDCWAKPFQINFSEKRTLVQVLCVDAFLSGGKKHP